MTFVKKQGAAFYFNVAAIILSIAGIIAMVMSSTYSEANALADLNELIMESLGAILLIIGSIWVANSNRANSVASLASIMGAIALTVSTIGNVISSRILLISGLFSFNSQNTVGWHVFYVTVVCLVLYVASILAMIIGSFLKETK